MSAPVFTFGKYKGLPPSAVDTGYLMCPPTILSDDYTERHRREGGI